jgi:hypothetical protein
MGTHPCLIFSAEGDPKRWFRGAEEPLAPPLSGDRRFVSSRLIQAAMIAESGVAVETGIEKRRGGRLSLGGIKSLIDLPLRPVVNLFLIKVKDGLRVGPHKKYRASY